MNSEPVTDHRPGVAAIRREKMRRRLIESAVLVFAEKGVDASVIDDVINVAGVARGTFYNYFTSNQELLVAANEELENELLTLVEARVENIKDPKQRIATGLLLFLKAADQYPFLAKFVNRVGLDAAGPGNLVYEYLPPHIVEGIDKGIFVDTPITNALDLIAGVVLVAMYRISSSTDGEFYAPHAVATIMRGLGVNAKEAWFLANTEIKELTPPSHSLLAQSQDQTALKNRGRV